MYNVNNPYYKNHIFDLNREIDMEVYIGEDKIDNSEVLSKLQFTFDSGMEEYTVGKIIYGKLETVFYNTINITNGSIITVKLKLKVLNPDPKIGWEWVTVPWGSYIVTEVVKKELVINVTAYPSLYTKLNLGFFPDKTTYDTRSLMEEIARKLEISFNANNISKIDLENPVIKDAEGNETEGTKFKGKTYAELISLVAMLCASNVIFTRDGSIEFKKLDFNKQPSDLDVKLDNYKQPTRGEDVYTIKQVKLINETNTPYTAGETVVADQILSLSNQFATDNNGVALAQSILNEVKNISYKAWSSTFKAPLHLDPLDIVTFNYKGEAVKVPAMYTKYTFAKNVGVCEIQSKVTSSTNKQTEFTGTITQKVNNIYTDVIQVKDMKADKVSVNRLDAEVANIKELYATNIRVDELDARKANITDLNATNAQVENLKAKDAEIENLVATKADIVDLNATNANIDNLTADVADINTLLSGNISSGTVQTIVLTSKNVVIKDAIIDNAAIKDVDAGKINAGTLNTNNVIISSGDESMILQGNLQQFKDKDGNLRIQMGKDAKGNFTFVLYDEDGKGILINENGIQDSNAIKDGLIVNTHVADNANISANKLDIGSLVTVIEDDGSLTLKSSNILMDAEGQTLSAAFSDMNEKVENNDNSTKKSIETLSSSLTVAQGEISTLINRADVIETTIGDQGDSITTLNNNYSALNQTVNGISSTVGEHTTQISDLDGRVTTEVSSLNSKIEQTKKDITLSVSETYITKTDSQTNINKAKTEAISTAASDATTKANNAKTAAVKEANANTTNVLKSYSTTTQMNAAIQANSSSITSKVESLEENVETVTTDVNGVKTSLSNVTTRLNAAEQKITDDAIISTVSSVYATKSELEGVETIISKEVDDLSGLVDLNIGADAITPQMKAKLVSEWADANAVKERLHGVYLDLKDWSLEPQMLDVIAKRNAIETLIVPIQQDMNTVTGSGLGAILDAFSAFYTSAEDLNKLISYSLKGITDTLSTKIEQTNSDIKLKIDGFTKEIGAFYTHFEFGSNGLTIRSSQNATKYIVLDNDSLDFKDSGEMVAQISDQRLLISKAEITDSMKLGNLKIKPSGKGGVIFVFE